MRFHFPLLIALLTLMFAASTVAGELAPGLDDSYWASESDFQPVIAVMATQAEAAAIDSSLSEARQPLAARHAQLIDSLRVASGRSKNNLAKSLEILTKNSLIQNVDHFWLANLLVVECTREGAELLANSTEIAEVGAALSLRARSPVETTPDGAKLLNIESSLEQLNAPRAWAEGFYGIGRTICLIDQSVRTDHPALGSRWRGNETLRAESYFADVNLVESCGDDRMSVLGCACGADPDKGDTLGVAPGASWIAGRLFCSDEAEFADLLRVLQWAADPDGDPDSFDDVPDVVAMSFQVGNGCDARLPQGLWLAIEHLELLGPVCLFAASNQGESGERSVELPEAAEQAYAIGNLDLTAEKTSVHASSGLGPSPCKASVVKPDLVAPGTKVRTTMGDGYATITGTSAALGYVAGTVALMREANPEIRAREVKKLLGESARDLGLSGKDNVYGWGMLQTDQAVLAAKTAGSSGTITGLVRYGGIALPGAIVELTSAFDVLREVTTINGGFAFSNLPTDRDYRLQVGRFGFAVWESDAPILLEKDGTQRVVVNMEMAVRDDVEFDQGWMLGVSDDDATGGFWERAIPVPTYENNQLVQVDEDASEAGRYCFVTGNADAPTDAAGVNDVDGGKTTLRSPVFSLRELEEPRLTFQYAYSNDRGGRKGGDFFRAQISNDGGVTWKDLLRTSASTNGWSEVSLALDDFIESTDLMVLQFVCDDRPPATLVEAAVDEIEIQGKPGAPEPPRDLQIHVEHNIVYLNWRKSQGASTYNIYLSNDPNRVVLPEYFFTSTADTTFSIPLDDVPYDQFYFQITASR